MEAPGDQPHVKLNPLSNPVPYIDSFLIVQTIGDLYWQFIKISVASLLKLCNCKKCWNATFVTHNLTFVADMS